MAEGTKDNKIFNNKANVKISETSEAFRICMIPNKANKIADCDSEKKMKSFINILFLIKMRFCIYIVG